jgi:hypothetical protein
MLRAACFLPSQLRAAWEHLDRVLDECEVRVDAARVRELLFGHGPYEFLPSETLAYRTPHPVHLPASPLYVNAKNGHRYTPADPSNYCYRPVDSEWSALFDPLLGFTDRFYFAVPPSAVASRRRGAASAVVYDDESANPVRLPVAGGVVVLRRATAADDAVPWQVEISHVVECRDASGLVELADVLVPTLRGYPDYDAPAVFERALQEALVTVASAPAEQHA